jgi:hypothetical protein
MAARRADADPLTGDIMSDHVYRITEVVGCNSTSVDDAIRNAVRRA